MSFKKIVGHETAINILQRAVASKRLPTGYLFTGPPHVGKTKTALELAKAINCPNRPDSEDPAAADACDECDPCSRIEEGKYAYVRVEFPMLKTQQEQRKKQIKKLQEQSENSDIDEGLASFERIEIDEAEILINPIREMLKSVNLKAPPGVWKICLIQRAEKLRAEAANRLLKTLEEPPPQTTFILTTSRPADVLPTIVSRCQIIEFGPVPAPAAQETLQEQFPDSSPQEVEAIVAASAGCYGWAYRMLSHRPMLAHRKALLKLLAELPNRQLFEGMRLAEQLIELAEGWFEDAYDPASPEAEAAQALLKSNRSQILRTAAVQLLDVMLTWWRDITLLVSGADGNRLLNRDHREELSQLATVYDDDACRRALRWIEEASRHFLGNANLRLTAEVLMLKLISLSPSRL